MLPVKPWPGMGQTKRFGHTDVAMAGTRMYPARDPARDTAVPRMVADVDVDRGEAEDGEADMMTGKVEKDSLSSIVLKLIRPTS